MSRRGAAPSLVDLYIDDLYKKDYEEFSYIRKSAGSQEGIQISPYEGKIMFLLLVLQRAKVVVEIGAFVGYSTAWIGSALPEDGKLISFEINQNNFRKAQQNIAKLAFANKIKFVNAAAEEKLHKFINIGEADAFFIDAKKSDYITYLKLSTRYLKKGGLLIADNTIISRRISDKDNIINKMPEGIKLFNAKLADSSEFMSTIIKTTSGLTIGVKS